MKDMFGFFGFWGDLGLFVLVGFYLIWRLRKIFKEEIENMEKFREREKWKEEIKKCWRR